MRIKRLDWLFLVLIVFITIVTVFDLFTNVGRSANMDGLIHTTTAEMFANAMRQGEFPVTWIDGFGNYGLPLGLIAQQLTSYLTAFIIFIVHNPVLAYNITCFIGLLFSNIFFYIFLRIYLPEIYSFLATFLFNFAPYRIINLYIRGAIPEAFSTVFLPLILLSLYVFVKKRKILGLFGFALLIAALALTHPMVLVIYSFLFIPYFIYLIVEENGTFSLKRLLEKEQRRIIFSFFIAIGIGLGIASYYIIPLELELKYFYYGATTNHLTENQYLGLKNYFDPFWYYFTKQEILTRGHFIQAGLIETIGVLIGLGVVIQNLWKKKKKYSVSLFDYAVVMSLIIIFFTTKFADPFYRFIDILSNIQFPWRMFTALMFLPPILYGYFFKKLNNILLVILFIMVICFFRFPQLYGKNYVDYPTGTYDFTVYNLHSTVMNTIWSKRTEDYPIKKEKPAIIAGTGTILSQNVKNSQRTYTIDAKNDITMVDYTFYFPGWHVFVDGQDVPIQFQNTQYQGIITYPVPAGKHTVLLRFEDTKIRKFAKIGTGLFLLVFIVLIFLKRFVNNLVFLNSPTRIRKTHI